MAHLVVAVLDAKPKLPAMTMRTIEQVVFDGSDVLGRSPGVADSEIDGLRKIIDGFGTLAHGVKCLFVQPLSGRRMAVVEVSGRRFRSLLIDWRLYRQWHDPFAFARRFPSSETNLAHLPALEWFDEFPPDRSVRELRNVLREDDSATLLGAAQSLVDGGCIAFERDKPDPLVVERLWKLLPASDRGTLTLTTFAPSHSLDFRIFVGSHAPLGYLTDRQAGDYPEGRYELALQLAVETDDAARAEDLFARRSGSQALRFAFKMLIGAFALGIALRWIPWEKLR